MVIRGENIGERVKYWVRPDIINRIEEGSIKAYFNSEITKIETLKITIKTPEGFKEIKNDYVVALTGYKPDFSLLNEVGITFSEDEYKLPHYNPETMESNIEGTYLAGVICGGMQTHKWFIENSRIHAEIIAKHLENFNFWSKFYYNGIMVIIANFYVDYGNLKLVNYIVESVEKLTFILNMIYNRKYSKALSMLWEKILWLFRQKAGVTFINTIYDLEIGKCHYY